MPVILWGFQGEDAGAALAAAMAGALGGKPEARGNGPLPGGGGLMEEMLLLHRSLCPTLSPSELQLPRSLFHSLQK